MDVCFFDTLLSSLLLEEQQFFFAEWGDLNLPQILTILCYQLGKVANQTKERHNLNKALNAVCIVAGSVSIFMHSFILT